MRSAGTPQQERVDNMMALAVHAQYESTRCVGEREEVCLGYWVIDEDWGALAPGDKIALVAYVETGIAFTPFDWQARQPDMDSDYDIATTRWVDEDGNEAGMMDGLPVRLG